MKYVSNHFIMTLELNNFRMPFVFYHFKMIHGFNHLRMLLMLNIIFNDIQAIDPRHSSKVGHIAIGLIYSIVVDKKQSDSNQSSTCLLTVAISGIKSYKPIFWTGSSSTKTKESHLTYLLVVVISVIKLSLTLLYLIILIY